MDLVRRGRGHRSREQVLDDDLRRWDCPRTTAHRATEAARESVVLDWWGGRVCDFCPESLVECSAPLSISRIAGQHSTQRAERAVGLLQFLRSGNWVDESVDRALVASRPMVFLVGGAREEISRAGLGVGVYGDPGLAQAVKKDPAGIGYNNLAYLYDLKTRKQVAGVQAIPIDVNGNGRIDTDENFYETIDKLTEAIASGKYPSPPARNLGFLFKGKPQRPEIIAFVKFVLGDGQKYVEENGYISLSKQKIAEELKKL